MKQQERNLARQRTGALLTLFSAAALSLVNAATAQSEDRWVTAWATSPHAPLHFPGLPPTPTYKNQTIRMIVKPELSGDRLRVQLSNAFGAPTLKIGSVHVALLDHDAAIVPQTDHIVTFGGQRSINVPPGAPALSDPIELKVSAFSELAVSLFVPDTTPADTTHLLGQHETYVSGPGDLTGSTDFKSISSNHSWVWLDRVEVHPEHPSSAIIAFGDSITDGYASTPGSYLDWPDLLARRLSQDSKAEALSVINEGIGGNRILHNGAGVSALARLDRDVLANPGVSELILLEGINDIGWPHMKPPKGMEPSVFKTLNVAQEDVSAEDLIGGMKQIIARSHEHGIRVFGATILPFDGADYFSPSGEEKRQAINQWIRTGGSFDGVVDLDAAVRDPDHPSRLLGKFDSGDHLHPSNDGYKAMAGSIDLGELRKGAHSARVR